MRIAIIPARGGSKEIPRKNIKLFAGKPLISWTIDIANNCDLIDKVVVSTDDNEIAEISLSYGAEIPFIRPDELASDRSPVIDTIIHYLKKNSEASEIILMQPTSPLRKAVDLYNIIETKLQRNCRSIVSITEAYSHPSLCYQILKTGELSNFMASPILKRRQDLSKAYCLNGSIYLANRDFLIEKNSFIDESTVGFVMPQSRSIDIDNNYDWEIAEMLFMKSL